MSAGTSKIEGCADLVTVRVEHSALAVDLLLRSADAQVAEPVTIWLGRPADRRLAWLAEKHLYDWGGASEPVEVTLDLGPSQARASLAANQTRLTFDLVAAAGLPSAHRWA